MSSANTALTTEDPIECPAISDGLCLLLRHVEPLYLAAIKINATVAAIWRYPITLAGIGTVQNASSYGKRNGLRPELKTSFPYSTSMWSSPSPQNSIPLSSAIRKSCIIFSSVQSQRRLLNLPMIPSVSAHVSASWEYCILGDKISWTILISIVSLPVADCLLKEIAGSLAEKDSLFL